MQILLQNRGELSSTQNNVNSVDISTELPNDTNDSLNTLVSENFEFAIDRRDTLFVFTQNRSIYKDNLNTLTTKMVIINDYRVINIDELSLILGDMGIDYLNIFSININVKTTVVSSEKHCKVKYVEINPHT